MIVAADGPGFIVNRCNRPFSLESLRIVQERLATPEEVDRSCRAAGFRMGPFELMDLVGLDVGLRSRSRSTSSRSASRAGGRRRWWPGWWRPGGSAASPAAAGTSIRASARETPEFSGYDPILERIVVQLVNEACFALGEGVGSADDIDAGMVLGLNHPRGPLEWGDAIGADQVLAVLERLYADYREERYRPAPLLLRAAREGTPLRANSQR